jgi:hypothetical protein
VPSAHTEWAVPQSVSVLPPVLPEVPVLPVGVPVLPVPEVPVELECEPVVDVPVELECEPVVDVPMVDVVPPVDVPPVDEVVVVVVVVVVVPVELECEPVVDDVVAVVVAPVVDVEVLLLPLQAVRPRAMATAKPRTILICMLWMLRSWLGSCLPAFTDDRVKRGAHVTKAT